MDAEAVFNRYDIRGDYPDEIDDAFAEQLGKATGAYVQDHVRDTVVVGRDTRDSSEVIYDAFIAGIQSTGANVIDVGVGPTDRVALAAQHYGGIGVTVTASHHDWSRTGFKFLYEQGHGFSNGDLARVKELFQEQEFPEGSGALLREQHEFDETYIDAVTDAITDRTDSIEGTVVLDTVGAAQRSTALIFEELGFTVEEMDRDSLPDPEPTPDTRSEVQKRVEETGADLGIGFDPDADRVYIIHPDQGWIDGDRLFYLLGRLTQSDTVVASLDTSPLIEELDADITYTRVGDVFVSEKGVELDADLLGEPNGHYAVTDFCWYNSGIFAGALLAAHHDQLSELLNEVADWNMYRSVQRFEDEDARDAAMNTVAKQVAQNYDVLSTEDGFKFAADNMTGLVRPSGTSPKIRLIVHYTGDKEEPAEEVKTQLFNSF